MRKHITPASSTLFHEHSSATGLQTGNGNDGAPDGIEGQAQVVVSITAQ